MEQGESDTGIEGDALAEDVAKIGETDEGAAEINGGKKESFGGWEQASRVGTGRDGEDEHDADTDAEAGGDAKPILPLKELSARNSHQAPPQSMAKKRA